MSEAPEKEPAALQLPEPSFSILVAQLTAQALMQLGEMPNPLTGRTEPSKTRAQFTIDLLEIVRERTHGNLSNEEEAFLDRALYDLKMRFARLVE